MAFCSNCGSLLAEGARFCRSCGAPIKTNIIVEEPSLDVTMSINVALIGPKDGCTKVEVFFQHLDKTITIDVPNSVSVGHKIQLPGLGYTAPDGKKGNAYLHVEHITYKPQGENNRLVCKNCGREMPDDTRFCLECGANADTTDLPQKEQRRVVYEGEIHKCPNCGDPVEPFETTCNVCGFVFRDVEANSSVKKFEKAFLAAKDTDMKVDIIRSFTVPNSVEDISEFALLAAANVDVDTYGAHSDEWKEVNGYRRVLSDAWLAKLEVAMQKAEIMFAGSKEYTHLREIYEKKQKEIKKKKLNLPIILFLSIGLPILLVLSIVIGVHIYENSGEVYDIAIERSSEEICGQDYEATIEWLKDKGFRKIRTEAEHIGLLDFWSDDNAIKSISINGVSEFDYTSEFPSNALIKIVYWRD